MLDPYAVIANGDPSQLHLSSKRLLVSSLRRIAETDPYFRRSDAWRRFYATGLFTPDLADDLKPLLTAPDDGSHLRHLILELLHDAPVVPHLTTELHAIVRDAAADAGARHLAWRCLATANTNASAAADVAALVAEATSDSLRLAAEIAADDRGRSLSIDQFVAFFRALAVPVPGKAGTFDTHRPTNAARIVADSLDRLTITTVLDWLTATITCTCPARTRLPCGCRARISAIASVLIDRAYRLEPIRDAGQLWRWVLNLRFDRVIDGEASRGLRADDATRRTVQQLARASASSSTDLRDTIFKLNMGHFHPGLGFTAGDIDVFVDRAFDADDVDAWTWFAPPHKHYARTKGPDPFRARIRRQALLKPAFARVWFDLNRRWRQQVREQRFSPRWLRQRRINEARAADQNRAHLIANRGAIEQGKFACWNYQFAQACLHFPEQIPDIVDDPATLERALDATSRRPVEQVPTLAQLASNQGRAAAEVLHAACLLRFRSTGSLANIDPVILAAAKTDAFQFPGYAEGEFDRFEAELDAQLFRTPADVEAFARAFIAPSLADPSSATPHLWWLKSKLAFATVRTKLARDWLEAYPDASQNALDTLFDIAAAADPAWTLTHIQQQCSRVLSFQRPLTPEQAKLRAFWFLRHFFFATHDRDAIWTTVLSNPDGIFAIDRHAGWLHSDAYPHWPSPTADKIYRVFDAYVAIWPRVPLPDSWGRGSPPGETAYRTLSQCIWMIERDPDTARALAVLETMLADQRFSGFLPVLRSLKANLLRKTALTGFVPPAPQAITSLLDQRTVATVEDLRALFVEEIEALQVWLHGTETKPLAMFWPGGRRVDENTARDRIVDQLQHRFKALDASVAIEHFIQGNRCDITAAKMFDGRRALLVCEVKGQWHSDLFIAAAAQLDARYAIHPDAAQQGVYLVLWFGPDHNVAGRKNAAISSPAELKAAIIAEMPQDLLPFVDVVVLDLEPHSASHAALSE